MTHIASVHSRPSGTPLATRWASGVPVVAKLWRELFKALLESYRPELHYMRGPGPRWRERHGTALPHGSATQPPSENPVIDRRARNRQ